MLSTLTCKIMASDSPANLSTWATGMDISPMFVSAVLIDADGITTTYQDDLVVRKRATILPSGNVGAVFTGLKFLSATPGVRLNFTVTFPGAFDFYKQLQTGDTPNPPWRRAGGGRPELPRIYNSSQLFWPIMGQSINAPTGYGRTIIPDLYQAFDETVVPVGSNTVNGLSCASVTNAARQQWCRDRGFTVSATAMTSKGVLITDPIAVAG